MPELRTIQRPNPRKHGDSAPDITKGDPTQVGGPARTASLSPHTTAITMTRRANPHMPACRCCGAPPGGDVEQKDQPLGHVQGLDPNRVLISQLSRARPDRLAPFAPRRGAFDPVIAAIWAWRCVQTQRHLYRKVPTLCDHGLVTLLS